MYTVAGQYSTKGYLIVHSLHRRADVTSEHLLKEYCYYTWTFYDRFSIKMKNRTVCLVFVILLSIVVRSLASSVTLTISSNATGTKGSTVRMACIITHYPSDDTTAMYKMTAADALPGSLIFYCHLTSSTCNSVSNPSSRYTYNSNTTGMYLTISDVQHEDTGWWRCYLDGGGVSSNVAQLVVYASPVGVTYSSQPIGSQDLAITSVTVVCQTIDCSYPASTFIWYSVDNNTRTVYRNSSPGKVVTVSSGCTSPENKYSSTLTLPRYTISTDNVPKTAKFVCGISHPSLTEEKLTPLTEYITFAVRVTSVSLTYEGTIPATGTEIHAVTGTRKTLGVEWSPTGSNPHPTITCYVGIIATVLPGSVHTFTFTVLDNLDNNEIYCTANNIGPNEVSTNKLQLKLVAQLTAINLKNNDNTPMTGDYIMLLEGLQTSFTIEVTPVGNLQLVTITCYIGETSYQLFKAKDIFNFTAAYIDHDKILYCKANNMDLENFVFTNVPILGVTGTPDPPSYFSSTPGSRDSNTVYLYWLPGYHGRSDQTFHIDYRSDHIDWTPVPSVRGGQVQDQLFNVTVSNLVSDTTYEFRISSSSATGMKDMFKHTVAKTAAEPSVCTCSQCNYVGPAVGASFGGIAVAIVIAAVIFFFCRQTGKGRSTRKSKRNENMKTAEVKSTEDVASSVYYNIEGNVNEEPTPGSSCYQDLTNRGPVVVPVYQTLDVADT